MIAFGHEVNGQTVYFFKANEDVMFLDETDNIIHAVDKNDKTECWFLRSNKRLHREDGPSFTHNGLQVYHKNSVRHRENGPAFIRSDFQEWILNGRIHRLNGPAVIREDGSTDWYIDGVKWT